MPRLSDKMIRAEQRAASNERHSSRSTRTSASENKSSSRRRSLSAGLDPSTRKAARSTQPQHALVSPQRYTKPKVSRTTLNDHASTKAMEEQFEKERLAAQQLAMASFEYRSDDDSSQAQISVLDVTTDDEASFDQNLIIEKIRKPRKAKRPPKTATPVEQSTNNVNLA